MPARRLSAARASGPARLGLGHSAPAADAFPRLVLTRAGIDADAYRDVPLQRRVPACVRALRARSEPDARAQVHARPGALDQALDALLIGVSAWFRDPDVFGTLRERVLPQLSSLERPVRVLSIGCANGAELYSVAALLAEAGLLNRSWLTGADCRPAAIAEARHGLYSDEHVDAVPDEVRRRYLSKAATGWRVADPLRRRVSWQLTDATRRIPTGGWDLVLCRNLVIYLRPPAAGRLFVTIGSALMPAGFLVVGKAERPPADLGFRTIGRCTYQRHA